MFSRTQLIGRIGQIKKSATKEGTSVTQFSIVTSKSYKDKQTNDWVEINEWHNIVSFDKCADHVSTKLQAGDLLMIEGENRTRKYTDKNGEVKYTTNIHINQFPKKLPRYYTKDDVAKPASNHIPNNSNEFNEDFDAMDIPF